MTDSHSASGGQLKASDVVCDICCRIDGWITLREHVIGSLEPSAADVQTLRAIQGSFLTTAHLKAVLDLVSLMKCSSPHIYWGLGCSAQRAVGLSQ